VGLAELGRKLAQGEALVAGVLSGTSGDGIDVALVRFGTLHEGRLPPPRMEAFRTLPFPGDLAPRVRAALDGKPLDQREVALLSRDLGRAFGRAARELAQARGLELDLAGSHGQTVWHHDGVEPGGPATLQLGDGDFAAEEAGCAVVSDFRQRDIAAGGEGAPISIYADDLVFAELPRPAAVLNFGGMANLSILPAREGPGARDPLAFDTGPACSLLDGLARALLGAPYDEGGARASEGRASERLVRELLEHPFLRRAPPKSTGRDTFGEAWVGGILSRARELGVLASDDRPEDLLASAAEFVARHAVLALREHGGPGLTWLVACGGGARNAALLEALARLAPQPLATSEDFGVDPDAREALVFAVLAARCVLGEAVTRPSATGARAGRVLGKISPPLASQTGST
jgi:anhydro-N-acetylmuramic acid kinase